LEFLCTMSNKKVDLKCVLLGRAAVGKSCLVERFLHERYVAEQMPTVGAAFGAKAMRVGKRTATLGIWDTAGSERYESMTRHYYKGAEAAVVCYDLTDVTSFAKVKFWVNELLAIEENAIIALVGTKLDLIQEGKARGVSQSEVKKYAHTINAREYETSARLNIGVDRVFQDIVEEWEKKPKTEIHEYNPVISLGSDEKKGERTLGLGVETASHGGGSGGSSQPCCKS